jgi:FkbM family methyltransferase
MELKQYEGYAMELEKYEYAGRTWWVRPRSEHNDTDRAAIHENWGQDQYGIADGISGRVLDIGANIGTFSLRALAAGASSVICYEPDPDNIEVFKANCSEEIERGVIELHERAVWNYSGLTLGVLQHGGGSAVVPTNYMGVGDMVTACCLSTRLSSIISMHAPITFMKMDIEGGEYRAIVDCPVEILSNVGRIAMEFHAWDDPMMRHLASIYEMDVRGGEAGGLLFGYLR